MPSGVSAGHETRVAYLWEDNGFNAAPTDSTHKTPGANAQVNTTEGTNALRRVFRPGKRTAIDQLALVFEGSFALQATITNPWFFRALLGAPNDTDNGDGSYTYDYTGTSPDTMQIIEGHEQSGKERVLSGCMVTRVSIETSVEEEATVAIEGAYADEELKDPASLTAQPKATDTYDPMTFAEGSVSIDGATEGYVQNMTVTIEANVDPIREMGTRIIADYNPKVLAPSLDFGKIHEGSHDNLKAMYGGSSASSPQEDADDNKVDVVMTFDNGKSAGSGINKADLTVTGTLTESYDESGIGDPRADLEETVNRAGEDFNVSWTNEEASAP